MVRFLVDHATTVVLAVICIFAFGVASYVSLPRESSPDITIPVVLVTTPYQGVSPEDVEGLVTIPIENELASLRDVKKMSSTSAEGVSVVSIEFEPDVIIEDALQRVRDRVNRARPDLPSDVDDSSVREISFSDLPIMLITLSGSDEQHLKLLAEDLEDDITRIAGVLEANVSGGQTREIHVDVIPERLGHYGLKFDDIIGAIRDANVNVPGGDVNAGRGSFLLRVPGEFTEASQIADVAVKRVGDRPVFVRDLARVTDGFEDRETYARMNGRPSVTISVSKRAGANIIELADAIKALMAERSTTWEEGVDYRILADQSKGIANMVSDLQNNIITALILVVGVILLFMGVRSSSFVAIAIPLSMLMSFVVIQALGFTLNMIVLFSLILALGMLVDNAIVVVENIYRHLEEGRSPYDAAIEGTNEVAIAVAASTATTVAAFFPMVFWTGIMGEFMGFLPKTLIIVLTASLLVAIMILPVVTSRLLPAKGSGVVEDETRPIEVEALGPMMRLYHRVLEASIRFRYLSVAAGVISLVGTLMAYSVLNHGTEFFPATQPDRATISVRSPEGTDLEATDKIVRMIEAILAEEPNVDVFVAETGVSGGGNRFAGSQAASHEARITVDFLPSDENAAPGEQVRVENTMLTVLKLRAAVQQIPGARITVEKEEMGPPVGAPIGVEVSGDDFHEVGELAQHLRRRLSAIDGVTELEDDYRIGRPELRLRVDRGAASRVGVSTSSIGNAVRTAVAGAVASKLRDGEDEYDIVVRLAPESRSDLQTVLGLRVPGRKDTSPDTFPVPISTVASYEMGGGSGSIKHVDQELIVTVKGDVLDPSQLDDVRAEVAKVLEEFPVGPGQHLRLGGANDEEEAASSFLVWAFGLAVALILMVLVAQFDSVTMPAIILFTVLLSLVGVLWGLILTGTPFGIIMTGIGVISLAGVVVNNAIVLLDYVEQLRARGLGMRDALIRAGITRFRPVMLTAVTTTLGLVPMAIGVNIDFTRLRVLWGGRSAEWWGPMAVAVIFGLTFATVLTLVMVPTLYSIKEDFTRLLDRIFRRGAPTAAKVLALGVAAGLLAPEARAVSLQEAFQAAAETNVDLAMLREQTFQTRTQRGKALSYLSPQLSAQFGFTLNQYEVPFEFSFSDFLDEDTQANLEAAGITFTEPEPLIIQPKYFFSGSATVSQTLYNGSVMPALLGIRSQIDAAESDEGHQSMRIRGAVARVYYGLATAREAVAVSEAAVKTAQDQLLLAERQLEAGLTDRRAVLQAQLLLSQSERDLLSAGERVIQAEEAFTRTTGLPRDSAVELPGGQLVQVPGSVEEAVVRSANRGDVSAADHRVDAAQLLLTSKRMEWLPTFSANFTMLYTQNTGFIGKEFQWQLGIQARWQLWDGGYRIAEDRELSSRVRMAELQERKTREGAEEEVRVAWERLRRADVALDAVAAEVELAEESLRLARRAFEVGKATWLEVEQAELSERASKLTQVTERMNRDMAAVDLLVAMGAY